MGRERKILEVDGEVGKESVGEGRRFCGKKKRGVGSGKDNIRKGEGCGGEKKRVGKWERQHWKG